MAVNNPDITEKFATEMLDRMPETGNVPAICGTRASDSRQHRTLNRSPEADIKSERSELPARFGSLGLPKGLLCDLD